MSEDNLGTVLDDAIKRISDRIRDLSSIEVITAEGIGDDALTIDIIDDPTKSIFDQIRGKLHVLARTRIEIDGDILVMVPTSKKDDDITINKEILELHNTNVATATQNWKNCLDGITNILKGLAEAVQKRPILSKTGLE
jgi:hypothetical protein